MEVLLHAHGGERAFDDELLRVVKVHAKVLRRVVVLAWWGVDQALVALQACYS